MQLHLILHSFEGTSNVFVLTLSPAVPEKTLISCHPLGLSPFDGVVVQRRDLAKNGRVLTDNAIKATASSSFGFMIHHDTVSLVSPLKAFYCFTDVVRFFWLIACCFTMLCRSLGRF